MFPVAASALSTTEAGGGGMVARVVSLRGFGGRRTDEAVLVLDGVITGSLLGGAADGQILGASADGVAVLLDVAIADDVAVGCGLACGGQVTALLQPISQVPQLAWRSLSTNEPVVVATYDRQLWQGARAAGLGVWPET